MKSINDIKLAIKAPLIIVGLVLSTAAMMYFFGHSVAVLGGVAIACGISFLIVRNVTTPLNAVNDAMARIADQDYEFSLGEASKRRDELGVTAKSIEDLKDKLAANNQEMSKSRSALAALDRSQAVIEFSLDGTIVTANENFLNTVGYSLNEIVGKHHSIFVDPKEASSPSYRAFWDKLGRGEFDSGKYKRIAKNGDEIWIRASYNPILDENGKAVRVMKFASDVTQAEVETNENRSKMDAIGRSQAVIEFSLDGKVITANENFLKTLGYSLDEIVGKHHSIFVDPKEVKTTDYRSLWDKLNRGEFDAGKYKRITKNGDDIWIQAAYNPLFDLEGKPYKIVKFATDITDIEKETNETNAKVNAISKSQAVIEFELDGTVIDANDLFLSVLGYSRDEIIGKHHRMFCDPSFSNSSDYQAHWERLRNGDFIEGHFQRVAKNGDPVWIQASYNPLLDLDGKPYKVVKFASDVTQIELDRKRNEEERAQRSADQAKVVSSLASGLQGLSEGDLTCQIHQTFAEEYEQLRSDFNAAVSKLAEAMRGVVLNADGIRTSAGEISQAADDLSRRTEGQAATLEQTAASLEELTASVKGAAEGADKANNVVSEAKRNAEESGEVVREAVDAMAEIEKSSEQISQIISVIDDIAFQTNLLALNAGVEAARAGDAGRGFAVVASEVRALAQRSSDAAKEIKTLISTSSQHVGRGVDLVGQAGKALHEIVDSVTDINELVSAIASSAKEQSTGIGEINIAVNQLDQVTQQNAAMVEESTAASHSMAQEAEELARMVAAFKTDAAISSVTGEVHKPARTAPSKPAVVEQRERAAKFATQQAAALKVGSGDDDWEDF